MEVTLKQTARIYFSICLQNAKEGDQEDETQVPDQECSIGLKWVDFD